MLIKKYFLLKNSHIKGLYAEYLCKMYLKKHKWKIIKSNYRNKLGEIDIIAAKENTLVAFEVKFRSNSHMLYWAISKQQQSRIYNAFSLFLKQKSCYNNYNKRFDALLVDSNFKIEHMENIYIK